ncbi:MAG: 4Fe-4S binding protein [Provencibacterium sp.]|jgi:ferredoxin|nr:4Fe-4S binding protein [Provencibacterium sp.]
MNRSTKLARIGGECVACGCCVAVCPREAIHILSGVRAKLDETKCVGCGRCAKECPAGVITITERGAML